MKIAIVNTSDVQGGAARAAYRLQESLIKNDIDSTMVVQKKNRDSSRIVGPSTKLQKGYSLLRSHIDALSKKPYKNRIKTPYSSVWLPNNSLIEKINSLNPDIIHLHWICGGLLRLEHLAKLRAPIVWSLHDMWAFTGGCHYNNEGCEKYTERCGQCPVLASHREKDLSRKVWKRKKKTFEKIDNMTIVGLSSWLSDEARSSSLFSEREVVTLPNPIDTGVFRPIDRYTARSLWNIPEGAPVVAFGAMSAASDRNKGYDLLIDALQRMERSDIHVIIFGASEADSFVYQEIPFAVHYTGHLHDDVSLVTLYNAADVMVVPSRQENLSNAIMESLSCGTPVVSFAIGGNGDMIEHKENGYLAEPYNTEDLAAGIEWVLEDNQRLEKLSQAARGKVVKEFDYSVLAPKYIELYNSIIFGNNRYISR